MSDDFEIEEGIQVSPERIVCYGPPGIGKSTWAANAPSPLFLDLEQGSLKLNVARNKKPIETWEGLLKAVDWVRTGKHNYQTLVIDTLDRAEWLCWLHVCATNKTGRMVDPVTRIEDVGGGFQKGYQASYEEARRLTAAIERCWRERRMHVVLLAHARLETVRNPAGPDYQRWALKMHEKMASLFVETSDMVLFASPQTIVKKEGHGDKRHRAVDGAGRLLWVRGGATWVAKIRYGVPNPLPLDWDTLFTEIAKASSPKVLLDTIEQRLAQLGDKAVENKIREYLATVGQEPKKLVSVINRLDVLIEEKAEREAAVAEAQQQLPQASA